MRNFISAALAVVLCATQAMAGAISPPGLPAPYAPQIHEALGGTNIGHMLMWADQNDFRFIDASIMTSYDASLLVGATIGGTPAVGDQPGLLFHVNDVYYPVTYTVQASDISASSPTASIATGLCNAVVGNSALTTALAAYKDSGGVAGHKPVQSTCIAQVQGSTFYFDAPFQRQDFGAAAMTSGSPLIAQTAHGYQAGQIVYFKPALYFSSTAAPAAPFVANTPYYAISTGLTANAYELSATPGGTAITPTASATGLSTHPGEVSPITTSGTTLAVAGNNSIAPVLDGNPIKGSVRNVSGYELQPNDLLGIYQVEWIGQGQDYKVAISAIGAANNSIYWQFADVVGGVGHLPFNLGAGVNVLKAGALCGTDADGALTACSASISGNVTIGGVASLNGPGTPLSVPNGGINAAAYEASGQLGYTGTKTAGSCVMTIKGGIITNVTGC